MNARLVLVLLAVLLFVTARRAVASVGASVATESDEGAALDLGGVFDGIVNAMSGKRMSTAGLIALQQREGFVPHVYADEGGKPTIGYGHLLTAFESWPDGIGEAEASALLASDVAAAEDAVAASVTVGLTQDQFDALVSFVFNIGAGAFRASTLLRLINAGDFEGARAQFGRWVYVTGGDGVKRRSDGLASRRYSEMQQFV